MKDKYLNNLLKGEENATWDSLISSKRFLRNRRAQNYEELINNKERKIF